MRATVATGPTTGPKKVPNKMDELALPFSCLLNHVKVAAPKDGKTGPSPRPKARRTAAKLILPFAKAVRAVKTDHQRMAKAPVLRMPNFSARIPPGTCIKA